MSRRIHNLTIALPILVSLFASQQSTAVGHPFEFAVDARMVNNDGYTIAKTYGYMTLVTDKNGNGTIDVMFSNGNNAHSARFNAQVKFLDADGAIIRQEYFIHWLAAAEFDEAIEGKVSKILPLSDFDSIQVDFYLSDISGPDTATANSIPEVRVSNAAQVSGF